MLAVATFAAVRSANRAARAAEQSLLAGLRPVLVPSRLTDEPLKVGFSEGKWMRVPGGRLVAETQNGVVYLAASLRNVGPGIGVLHGWCLYTDHDPARPQSDLSMFRRLTRDLYLPPGETGFWQGTFRDASDPQYEMALKAVDTGEVLILDLLYGDYNGGQRMITRFGSTRRDDGDWMLSAARHWHIDRAGPR